MTNITDKIEKINTNTPQKKLVKTKQSLSWNLVFYYLQMIYGFSEVRRDETYCKKYDDLYDYVTQKIAPPYESDIKEVYVVLEQEI
ncbi:MAG: hypothetical protein K2J89_06630 [Clostridia bacterium]|nr:hypothetical protein [Clostridia bacterium]